METTREMKKGEVIKETKYLKFIVTELKPKTVVVGVYNISHNDMIAEIEWYGPWRQYCFSPGYGTVWNKTCLSDVNDVIEILKQKKNEI